MARKRGKMALYEVMSKVHARTEQNRTVEPLLPPKKPEPVISVKPVPAAKEIEVPEVQETVNWRKKPRYLQYNLGRIEFSVPYQLAITAGLGLVLLLLLAFRFGQYSAGSNPQKTVSQPAGNSGVGNNSRSGTSLPGLASPATLTATTTATENTDRTENSTPVNRGNVMALGDPDGTNVIVIAEYHAQRDLEPVQKYFGGNGIPTALYQVGNKYQLWTIDRFKDNPANPGTKGNEVIKRIERIGKDYKAPDNYESFAPHKFSDAYGRKLEKSVLELLEN